MHHKIAIIGAGAVGSAAAYALMIKNVAAEIMLVDANVDKEQGEVMDLGDAHCFVGTGHIRTASFRDARSADIIIITAGAAQKPGESRLDLVAKNKAIVTSIFKSIGKIQKDAIVLMVTNPVDVLTTLAQKISGLLPTQVFGSGTTLDTARLKHMVGETLGVSPKNVHGYVLGEHGDSEFVAWSTVDVGGVSIERMPGMTKDALASIEERVKKEAYEIIHRKGMTNYGIGLTVATIVEAILSDQHRILAVSSPLHGWNGVSGVCLGAPAVIGHRGVEKVWPLVLSKAEQKKLQHSASVVKKFLS